MKLEKIELIGPDLLSAISSGSSLKRFQIEQLEEKLVAEPEDIIARTQLLSYYYSNCKIQYKSFCRHFFWMIDNYPEPFLISNFSGQLKFLDTKKYGKILQHCVEKIRLPGTGAETIKVLRVFFSKSDEKVLEEEALKLGFGLEPWNYEWPAELACYYETLATVPKNIQYLTLALSFCESEMALHTNPAKQLDCLSRIAILAFNSGRNQKASDVAIDLLKSISSMPVHPENVTYCGHIAHSILGSLALLRGEIDSAKAHLLKSLPECNAFWFEELGPDMSLAIKLLESGQREVVIKFLEQCCCINPKGTSSKRICKNLALVREGHAPIHDARARLIIRG